MAQLVAQGGSYTSEVRFQDGFGALVDVTNPLVDVFTSAEVAVVTDAVPVHDDTGLYHYVYSVPLNASLGSYRVHWTATIAGSPVEGDDAFTVVEAGAITFDPPPASADELFLRQLLGESIPNSPDSYDDSTLFTDAQITELLGRYTTVKAAAAVGWSIKAAILSELTDVEESGSVHSLSQRFKQAVAMANYWAKKADEEAAANGNAIRVAGKVASILGGSETVLVNEYIGPQTVSYTRPYPMHKMNPVLG